MSLLPSNIFNPTIGANLDAVNVKKEPLLTIGQFLKNKRNTLNLSINAAAKKMGIHTGTLMKMEKLPSLDAAIVHKITFKRFIDFYGIKQHDMDLVIGKPSLKKYIDAYPLNQIEAKNRLRDELSQVSTSKPVEEHLPKTFILKPPITLANILKDITKYLTEMNDVTKNGLLFDNMKKTSIDNIHRAKELLEDVELFDTFITERRQDKPELQQ